MVIIDEIGKMECFSATFIRYLNDILDSKIPLIATIALKGAGPIAVMKRRPDVELFKLTRENQDFILNQLQAYFKDNQ